MPDSDPTFTQAQVDAMVAERVATETAGLKHNQQRALDELKPLKQRMSLFDGIDPEKAKVALSQADDFERTKAQKEGDWTKLRDALTSKNADEHATKDKRVGKLETALQRRLTSDELRKELSGKVLPEYEELLVEHGAKFMRMNELDDDFGYVIHDGKGNPVVADGKGNAMTLSLFIDQTLKAKFPGAFKGSGSSGGGASKSTGGAGGVRTIAANEIGKYVDEILDGTVEVR